MSINIQIGEPEKKESGIKYNINVRKALNNDLIIVSHEDIDILLSAKSNKVMAFATDYKYNDKVYDTQNRFFKFLVKRGLIKPESVKSGNIFGVLEGEIIEPEDSNINAVDLVLLNVAQWIAKERPAFEYIQQYKQNREDDLVDPDEDESTPLGKVPQKDRKGANDRTNSMSGVYPPY